MAFLKDTYCQLCERFLTKEQWNKHLYSSRPLHRVVNGYWPAHFPQRKITRDECSILDKSFWEMISGSEEILTVYGFSKTYIMLITNMKDYLAFDDDCNDADFR